MDIDRFAEFVRHSNEIHNYKYDYSKSVYTKLHDKICIICKIHGEFYQCTADHKSGHGCPECKGNKKKTTERFICDAQKIHNHKYDYSLVKYINAHTKVIIICLTHGKFDQTPHEHLKGSGCAYCSTKCTQSDFIIKAESVHNNRYDYSKVQYKGVHTKVVVICRKHGEFGQAPHEHLRGGGCPKCSRNVSPISQKWLDSFNNPNIIREKDITVGDRTFCVDGFDPTTGTIYEFYGDFWHGNPMRFDPEHLNCVTKTSFSELYRKTVQKENLLKSAGFEMVSIWENDFSLGGGV